MLSLVPQALDNPGTVKWFSQITGFGFMAPDHASIDGVDHVRKIHGMASGAVNLRFR
jgi:cold shock CspA family protein